MKLGFWTLVLGVALAACQPHAADFALAESPPGNAPAAGVQDVDAERVGRVSGRILGIAQALCLKTHGAAAEECTYSVVLDRSPNVFASTNGHRVRISAGFVRYTAGDAELAFVIAHEAAHNLHAHSPALGSEHRYRQELEADRMGIELMAAAGFESRAALELLDRLSRSDVFAASDPAYPTFVTRSELLRQRVVELQNAGRAVKAAAGKARLARK